MRHLTPFESRLYIDRGRVLYCGPLQRLDVHRYGTAVLHVGVYGPFRIALDDGVWHSTRCAIIPAGTRHALDLLGGVHGKLFVERDSGFAKAFDTRLAGPHATVRFVDQPEITDCFRWVHEADPGASAVGARLDALFTSEQDGAVSVDGRVRRIIELIGQEPDRSYSQGEAARLIDLSASRFLHLFRAETGIPYRRFRVWRRLLIAVQHLHGGDDLTRAAYDAGFSDVAHFSHAFRDAFGVNPAPVFRKLRRFELSVSGR